MVQMKQNHEDELKTKQNQLYTANKSHLKNSTAVKASYETCNDVLREGATTDENHEIMDIKQYLHK
jgi:hypothetical protein